ncbi:MAG: hypothetical protein IPN70_00840 [Candidatus Moraniibacteriota bacterium]|nr:MAG: hypothetical protein IPN70_00840 [Candidatus Moranbacteria bacterium]
MNNNKKSSALLDSLHTDFKKIYTTMSEKNWHEQITFYLNKIGFFSGSPAKERMVTGWIAGLCERAYYVAAHRKPINIRSNFSRQLKKIISSTSLPEFLSCPGQVICGKRQPSFIEGIIPTLERLQVMERLPEVFGAGIDSIIIGGSMSYIPFFGIRENKKTKDFSDIDTLIVINNKFFKKASWKKFINDKLFPVKEKEKFLDRIKVFQKLNRNNIADVFSQKFSIVGKSFIVSNHFVTRSVFEKMVYTDLKKSLQTRKDMQYIMRDFRIDPFRHPCHARHTFDGQRFESVIAGQELESGGFISNMPGYIISNEKLYPGVYQTVISPAFLVFYDRIGETTKLVKEFENIIYREVKYIRKKTPSATYAKAHNRYDIFPLGRYDDGHNSYISPKEIKKYIPPPNFNIIGIKSVISPEEVIADKIKDSKENQLVRYKARRFLENWKRKMLRNAEMEIDKFINQESLKSLMLSSKEQGKQWATVAAIPYGKQIIEKIPHPYKKSDSKNLIVREELFTQIITPGDIMRLTTYEKLAQISGKVYVASIMDSKEKRKNLPLSYEVVIPIPT